MTVPRQTTKFQFDGNLNLPPAEESTDKRHTHRLQWANEAATGIRAQMPTADERADAYKDEGDVHRPHRADESAPDSAWMRMRTPSPEQCSRHKGQATLPPAALSYGGGATFVMQTPYLVCSPVLCFVPMTPSTSNSSFQVNTGADIRRISSWGSMQSMGSANSMGSAPENSNMDPDNFEFDWREEEHISEAVKVPVDDTTAESAPSKGSIGHPHTCAQSCKYFFKTRGCKDGDDCSHCHVCAYRHRKHRKSRKDAKEVPKGASAMQVSTPNDVNASMSPISAKVVETLGVA